MAEIVGLYGGVKGILQSVNRNGHFAMYVFSDRISYRSGVNFAKQIVKQGLGEVVEGPRTFNPNSTAYIRAWIWKADHDAIEKYLRQ